MQRLKLTVSGRVQGVGFRPFVYKIALAHQLSGTVKNSAAGVEIEIEGPPPSLLAFKKDLAALLPPLAQITSIKEEDLPLSPKGQKEGFSIVLSSNGGGEGATRVMVSPDVATCSACLRDIHALPYEKGNFGKAGQLGKGEKGDNPSTCCRRRHYPFTNCTDCGPRFTIIKDLPYDRPLTTMHPFTMCEECQKEYNDPLNRRFHAQPNACPLCGPQIWLQDKNGQFLIKDNCKALTALAVSLLEGKITAIKGLGGFQLCCNAFDENAITILRERKNRPTKPLAIMVKSIAEARKLANLTKEDELALQSIAAPIVLCAKRAEAALPKGLAPGINSIGLMLPYTPLHHLIMEYFAAEMSASSPSPSSTLSPTPCALVMTSGNRGGEPIAISNKDALLQLREIADLFLLHNRDILIRADDSVVATHPLVSPFVPNKHNGPPNEQSRPEEHSENTSPPLHFFRRARGFAPTPLEAKFYKSSHFHTALGVGAELKNTLCLATRGENAFTLNAFVSQHIGDITSAATEEFMREAYHHFSRLFRLRPDVIVSDLHPNYLSSLFAKELAEKLSVPLLSLQHHKAHAFSVLYENNFEGAGIVLSLDGSGYGEDKKNWGGEMILANTQTGEAKRIGHIAPMHLPGGDAAALNPSRMALACLFALGLDNKEFLPNMPEEESSLILQMLSKKANSPTTTSCGRLFDAVAALLGFSRALSYEGEAAIWLESIQDRNETSFYPCSFVTPADLNKLALPHYSLSQDDALFVLDTMKLVAAVCEDIKKRTPPPVIARRFHLGLAHGLADMACAASLLLGELEKKEAPFSTSASPCALTHAPMPIGLSGGVMQNLTLTTLLPNLIKQKGLECLVHNLLPPGDGCISFGQACWAFTQKARVT